MVFVREHVLTLLPKGGTGAEIGVWKGDFSARILDVVAPKRLHLIDPFEASDHPAHSEAWYSTQSGADMGAVKYGVKQRFADRLESGQIQLHVGRSNRILAGFPPDSLDFIYIDGDHTYAAVKQDLVLGFQACRSGALLCLDDYTSGRWWKDGVVRASNEFLGAHARECEIVLCHAGQLVIHKR